MRASQSVRKDNPVELLGTRVSKDTPARTRILVITRSMPAGMKRPGQSEAMKRVYAEKPGLVEVRRQQMAERWRLGLMNRAKIREGVIRSLAYRRPMSTEGRARQISAAQKTAAVLNSKIVPEHNAKVAARMRELISMGVQLIYVDLKGHQKPDLIWFDGKRIVSEDIKSTGTSEIEKEIIVT